MHSKCLQVAYSVLPVRQNITFWFCHFCLKSSSVKYAGMQYFNYLTFILLSCYTNVKHDTTLSKHAHSSFLFFLLHKELILPFLDYD